MHPSRAHSIASTRRDVAAELAKHGVGTEETERIIAHALGVRLETVLSKPELKLTDDQYAQCLNMTHQRIEGHSLAVLKGTKEFYGLCMTVTADTLIPRPETEMLVDEALKDLAHTDHKRILDMGTGSGCILIALAHALRQRRHTFTGADVSSKALAVARHNAKKIGIHASWIRSNLLSNIQGTFDYCIANLPYLTTRQLREPSIRREPVGALWGGEDGLDVYREFLRQAPRFLSPDATLLLEIDPLQAEKLSAAIHEVFPTKKILVQKDLSGRDRIIKITN